EERLESQIKGKRAEAELALEGIENEARETGQPIDVRAAYRAVSEVLGVNLAPAPGEAAGFDFGRFKKQIAQWAQAAVTARVRVGLVGTIERRIGASLGLGKEFNSEENWDSLR